MASQSPLIAVEVHVTHEPHFCWTSAACTHVGMVREINEDSCLDLPQQGIWAVADGMGVHACGAVASRMVVEALRALTPGASLPETITQVRQTLDSVNRQLLMEAVARNVHIIGSTVVVLIACGAHCAYLWAGDSRLYRLRDRQLQQLTRDHSQIEELKARADYLPDEVIAQSSRNLITRAVGAMDELETEHETIAVQDGDMFLLCSDGLSNEVSDDQMKNVLLAGNCKQAAQTLVELALQNGARDNVTVVVVHAEDTHSAEKTLLNPAI